MTFFKTPALVLPLPALLSLISGAHAVCYFPDGSVANGDVPCQSAGNSTCCCGEGYACLSNNICQATGDELQLHRPDLAQRGLPVLYYCTGDQNNATDCATDQNVFYFPGNATVLTTIGVTPPSSVSSATSVASSLPQAVPPPIPADPPSSSKAAIIGGAVGGGAGGIAMIALVGWLIARRRRRPSESTKKTKTSKAEYAPVQRAIREGQEDSNMMVHEAPSVEVFQKTPQSEYKKALCEEAQELPAPEEDPNAAQELPVPKEDLIPPQELPA